MNRCKRSAFFSTVLLTLLVLQMLSLPTFAATTYSGTLDFSNWNANIGLSHSGDADNVWKVSGGQIIGGIRKPKATEAPESTLTIKNQYAAKAELSFNYTYENVSYKNRFNLNGTKIGSGSGEGSIKCELDAGGTYTVYIKSGYTDKDTTVTISSIKLEQIKENISVTLKTSANGTYALDGITVTAEKEEQLNVSKTHTLQAYPNEGYTFYGWVDAEGTLYSTSNPYTLDQKKDCTVIPLFYKTDGAKIFKVGSETFSDLNVAAVTAKNGTSKTVILTADTELASGNYSIPFGVTFLIPYDSDYTVSGNDPKAIIKGGLGIANEKGEWTQPTAYKKMKLLEGAAITVNGALEVGGKHFAYSSQTTSNTTGECGFIETEAGSSIVVNSGGKLYAWGYIIGDGAITAESGAEVYEYFQVMDWRGGNVSASMAGNDKRVFLFSQYYVQNIEISLTMKSGSIEKARFSTAVSSDSMLVTTELQVIGNNTSGGMFILESGELTKKYEPSKDRMIYTINGTASLGSVSIALSAIGTTINANSGDYVLPMNSNMTLNITSGSTFKLSSEVAFLPGVEINIEESGDLIVADSVNLYVYDSDEWINSSYVNSSAGGQKFGAAKYSPTRTYSRTAADLVDTKIDVNGTLTVNGQLYTTAGGANICSSNGTGKVVLNTAPSADGVTHYQMANNSTDNYVQISITPAKLKNTSETYADYTETARAIAGDVFTYHDGVWGSAVIDNAADGYKGGYANLDRAIEYFPTDSTGSTYIKMIGDSTEPRATSVTGKNVYLDLYGKTVELAEGGLTISGTDADGKAYSLYGLDTSGGYTVNATTHAATYTDPKGKIVGTVSGLAKTYQTPETENHAFERYVAITSDGSTTTFHRFNISVTGFHVLLSWQADSKSYAATIFYHATARGDNAVQNAVSGIGFDLDGKQYSAEKKFDTEVDSTIGWGGIVDKSNVNTLYGAKAYLAFGNDTQESAAESHSLYDLLVMAYNSGNLRTGNDKVDAKTVLNQAMDSIGLTSEWKAATGQNAA